MIYSAPIRDLKITKVLAIYLQTASLHLFLEKMETQLFKMPCCLSEALEFFSLFSLSACKEHIYKAVNATFTIFFY